MNNPSGIEVKFSFTNEQNLDIDIDFNEQNDASCQLFGLFLHSLELEQNLVFNAILKKLKDISRQDKSLIEVIDLIFKYKHTYKQHMDVPVMNPSQVFGRSKK